jgi:ribosomal protein S18 acetylase RimI-like enzyme
MIRLMPTAPPPPPPVDDPAAVLAVFTEHRPIHAYGILDVVQHWETSRWWVRDRGVVGDVGLPGVDRGVVYAVSSIYAAPTLALLVDVADELPDRFDITGPSGMAERLASTHRAVRSGPHVKMHLVRPDLVPAPDPQVRALDPGDVEAVHGLFARTGGTPDFFRADLLGSGRQVGLEVDGELVAMAGVHLVDADEGIAVIGNVNTAPEHRGGGLARRVVATLVDRLRQDADLIALNVARDNRAACALYEGLGFVPLMEYEEAELVRT